MTPRATRRSPTPRTRARRRRRRKAAGKAAEALAQGQAGQGQTREGEARQGKGRRGQAAERQVGQGQPRRRTGYGKGQAGKENWPRTRLAHDKHKANEAAAEPAPVAKPVAAAKAAKPGVVAKADAAAAPEKKAATADPAPTGSVHADAPAPAQPLTGAQADAAGATPEFRWPARGRIIQGFKAGGNDGINIAVPEGTSVKAAESGVVAYAGSELKGYGNLVLIRHPNGFVSAYANNGELDVKRGETVKRGQIIAKSGQSGNVSSPQLHFELRKGSTPVDPTSYLAGL